jgi:hypothetical protein
MRRARFLFETQLIRPNARTSNWTWIEALKLQNGERAGVTERSTLHGPRSQIGVRYHEFVALVCVAEHAGLRQAVHDCSVASNDERSQRHVTKADGGRDDGGALRDPLCDEEGSRCRRAPSLLNERTSGER